jgi:hypothetical protein
VFWTWPVLLLLGGCEQTTYTYTYPAPDKNAGVIVSTEGHRPAHEAKSSEVVILVKVPPKGPDDNPPNRRIPLGRFDGGWRLTSIVWRDARTLEVCPLTRNPAARSREVVSPISGETYRFLVACSGSNRPG